MMGVYLAPNERHVAVFHDNGELAIHAVTNDGLGAAVVTDLRFGVDSLGTWSPSGRTFAFVDDGGAAVVVYVDDGIREVLDSDERARGVAISPEERRVAVLSSSSVTIYDRDVLGPVVHEAPPSTHTDSKDDSDVIAWSPLGQWIACSTPTCTIQVWDAESMTVVHELVGHRDVIYDLRWLGPEILASAAGDQTVRIWKVAERRELRILETDLPITGLAHAGSHRALLGWSDGDYLAWSTDTWEVLREGPVPESEGGEWTYRPLSPSGSGALVAVLTDRYKRNVGFVRRLDELEGTKPTPALVRTYANAKILLLGDSGVGKSGLGFVLAGKEFQPTESTHARRIWSVPVEHPGADREVMLWDLAGQPGYRIVHQLHLDDAAVAMVVFDSRSETAPLAGIGHWARALRHADPRTELATFLVAARTDRGDVGVSDERITEVMTEFGFRQRFSTSAKEGWGVAELRAAMLAAIDWSMIPEITSTALFMAAKGFVLEQKAAGTLLTPVSALHSAFLAAPVEGGGSGRDLLVASTDDRTRLRQVFDGCVARLASAGLVKRLAFGDLVLLQPELLDVYAGAIVNAARAEPDGLGTIIESRVMDADFKLPEDERIADKQQERLLIIATIEELTRHEIVLREETEEGVQLVFPSAFRQDLPVPEDESGGSVEFAFEGPVANIYATLVVRLSRSNRFVREALYQSAARFRADVGGVCTVHLVADDEGRGRLRIAYDEDVPPLAQLQFERFLAAHLGRRAIPGTVERERQYRCPECETPFSPRQVAAARGRGRAFLLCPVDETRVSLADPFQAGRDLVTEGMEVSADTARNIAAASSVILGKEETNDFDVFLCHNVADKPAVRWIAGQLRERGILPWLDEEELTPGRSWQKELQRQIADIRTAAVFVGPDGLGPWQDQEVEALLSQFARRSCPVIPVLLAGTTAPKLPLFLQNLTWVDLSGRDEAAIDRLIWGITGSKPGRRGQQPG